MTEQTQPTDAELRAWVQSLIADDDSVRTNDERDHMNFARAVLAKWGTPAGAGEPVAWMSRLPSGSEVFARTKDFYQDAVPVYLAPQPTQAQAGADAVVEEVAKGLRRYGLTLVKTASGYDVLSLRDVAAHGIKGADHA